MLFFITGASCLAALIVGLSILMARRTAASKAQRLNRELEELVALQTAQLRRAVADLEAEVAQRRQAERRYRTLVDHFPNGFVCLFDHELRYIIAGGSALPAIGLSSAQIEGKTLWDLGLPPHLERASELLYREALAGETLVLDDEINGHRFNGQAHPITDEHGAVIGGMIVGWDITERYAAEVAQRESEALFRDVWQSAVDAKALIDPNGTLLLVNPAFERLYGFPAEKAVGQPFTIIVPEAERHSALAYYRENFRAADPLLGGELVAQYVDGAPIYLDVLSSFIIRNGQRIAQIAIARDISGRKRAEEARLALERKLLETQRLESLGVLAGGIAHDFNNLLTGILGHAELASLDVEPGSEASTHVEGVIRGVRHTAELTRQLLAYAGRGRFVVQPLQLNTLIRDMADLLRVSAARHCTLLYELAPELPEIEADSAQMRQIVLNLIVNASEAIPASGGTITLSTALETLAADALTEQPPGPYVRLRVADTGAGMDAATLARIFDPFFSTKPSGHGLGLAAVQGIVRSHGGALRVNSAVGAGTTFDLWFPPYAGAAQASEPAVPQPAANTLRTVLVIDDEAAVREVARRLIERIGYSVVIADSGPAALALLEQGLPDLAAVLIDLLMPEMTGDAVARAIHAQRPDTPIILMSGYSAETLVEEYAASHLAAVIQKPFTLETLRVALGKAISPAI